MAPAEKGLHYMDDFLGLLLVALGAALQLGHNVVQVLNQGRWRGRLPDLGVELQGRVGVQLARQAAALGG